MADLADIWRIYGGYFKAVKAKVRRRYSTNLILAELSTRFSAAFFPI